MPQRDAKTPAQNKKPVPSTAEMLEQVRELLRAHAVLEADEKLIVAVSGGIDSMVLLDIMGQLTKVLGIELHIAHLDHQLRPDSATDSEFVEGVARQRGLPCTRARMDVAQYACQQRQSIEEAGRRLRYQFLDEVAAEQGCGKIALGHHAGDQAETVLLRLLRGSGTRGLGAMDVVREGRYLRPLLAFERSAIENYARAAQIAYREDASNLDLRFVRNRVRLELIPYLQQYFNPNIVQVLGRTAQILKEEDHFLAATVREALAEVICERTPHKIILDTRRLLDYHIAIQRRILRTLLQGLSKREGPFDFSRVEAVLTLLHRQGKGLHQIASELWGQAVEDRLILRQGSSPQVATEVHVPGETRIPSHGVSLTTRFLPARCFSELKSSLGGGRAAFDAEQTGVHLQLRSQRPGDRFQPLGMKGHKKLSDFLIDLKWPRLLRDEILLLARDDEIVWVAGLRPSHRFRVCGATRKIVLAELSQAARRAGGE